MKNKMTLSLISDTEITLTRDFNAPRELVFKAYTDTALIPRWWGPRGYTTVIEKNELKVGGVWRFLQTDPEGKNHAFNGVYREISAPRRLAATFEYEGAPGQIVLNSAVFEELGGKTRLTIKSTFRSREERDGMLGAGMERGAGEGYDRLEELLATMG
jgi:uncharacterized protein YndB with AHSA1/START domain